MKIGIIGIGLIGGSIAKDLWNNRFASKIYASDTNETNGEKALEIKLIDELLSLDELINLSEILIVAIPVNAAQKLLPKILDKLSENQVVLDMGSTKAGVCKSVKNHLNREQFVACHPIAGTENSGPEAAIPNLYKNNVNIICEKEKSSEIALSIALQIFDTLKMKTVFMSAEEHDRHIAYVSHLSHISSFVLGATVLDIEQNEKNIFNMAGSGFASTVRLAKSSPKMWSPIFEQNASHISTALGAYIDKLSEFKSWIDKKESQKTEKLMTEVNDIRRILEGIE